MDTANQHIFKSGSVAVFLNPVQKVEISTGAGNIFI